MFLDRINKIDRIEKWREHEEAAKISYVGG